MDEDEIQQRKKDEEEQQAQESANNRVNDISNNAQNVNDLKKLAKTGKGGVGAGTGEGAAAAEGAGAAGAAAGGEAAAVGEGAAGVTAAGTSPAWGTALAIIIIILLLLLFVAVIFMVVFVGGTNQLPACGTISASSASTTPGTPVTITLDNCTQNTIYSWSSSLGGAFNPKNGQSTLYTPSVLTAYPAKATITANVCSASNPSQCSQNTIEISIEQPTCSNLGGSCKSTQLCGVQGNGIISGANDCTTTQVCCSLVPQYKFYCQYGGVNSTGHLTSGGAWNYTYNGGKFCSVSSGNFGGVFHGSAGCAPTSVAMVLSSLGYNITPKQVSQQNSMYRFPSTNIGCNGDAPYYGTQWVDMAYNVRSWIKGLPGNYTMTGDFVSTQMSNGQLNTLKNYLNNGCLVLGAANVRFNHNGGLYATYGGHAFMITGADTNKKTLDVYDPTFCESGNYINRTFTNVTSISNASSSTIGCAPNGAGCGWIWAFAVCRN